MPRLILWLLTPLAALLIAGSVWWLGGWHDARHWPIRWLEVSGELERLTAAQVRAAVAEQAGRGFFAVNMEKARAEVERLPWVDQAAVSRQWPDALQIFVTERRAVARWKDRALVGGSGELFEVAGTGGMQGLVRLVGPEGRQRQVFDRWQQMRARLAAEGLEIDSVRLDARGAWRLDLESGPALLLGRDDVSLRLDRFLSVRNSLEDMKGIERIDLRYPNGFALTRRVADAGRLTRMETELNEQAGARPDHG
jgi:cell division protein FtsQ